MDQNPEAKNQNFFRKYQTSLILGVILVLAIIYFATRSKPAENEVADNQNQEQTNSNGSNDSGNSNGSPKPTPAPSPTPSATPTAEAGNVTAVGTLKASDNIAKGNLMVESSKGKIYIKTSRDQSALLGKQVTLQAEGTLSSFTFLGFKEGQVAGSQTPTPPAVGGGDTLPTTEVKASGTLVASNNAAKGNYVIKSASGVVYLQTQKDLTAWIDSEVTLTATGTLQNFTNATVTKK